MNELLLFLSIAATFTLMLVVHRTLGKEGLIGWVGVASILANILILKSITVLGIGATLGNVMFASNFLATDMLTENYGYKYAKKAVKFGLFSVCLFCAVTQFALLSIPNAEDFAQPLFETIFAFVPRITIASVSLFAVSNYVDIKLYEYMKRKHGRKKIWLRNNLATLLSNCTENFLFYFIAFYGEMPTSVIISMGISATIIEAIIALCDTPFLYLSLKTQGNQQV